MDKLWKSFSVSIPMNKEGSVYYTMHLVIIGAGEFQKPIIEKANEMGYETHVFAWESGATGKSVAHHFYPISVTEKELILEACKKIKPIGIVTGASDLTNITVQFIAERLGLIGNSRSCTEKTTNKFIMRNALRKAGIRTPEYICVSQGDEIEGKLKSFKFPLIIKPTDRSGSRGVCRVNSISDVEKAVQIALQHSFEKRIIIEDFIEGNEYSCETISYRGKHHLLAVTEKYTTGFPNYIETGHIQPAGLSFELGHKIKETVFSALDALEVENGAAHTELKVNGEGIMIIESGSRMGGDCIGTHLVPLSTGIDYTKLVINVACGIEPVLPENMKGKSAGIRFIFDKNDYDRLALIKREFPHRLGYVYETEETIKKITESGERKGFYIVIDRERMDVAKILAMEQRD